MSAKALAASAALLASLTQTASAAVWGFGDSNIDNGWYTVAPYSGEISFDVYLQRAPFYGIGKQTNNPGPMSIEVLADLLGVTALPANKPGGTNFATSGAKDLDPNTTTSGGFPNAVPTATQMTNFLASTRATGANDVFLIDSGANDVKYALTLTPTDQQIYLQQRAVEFAKAIKGLQLKGATHLIIVNQPETFGTAAAQAARHLYNTTLQSALASVGVNYVRGDRNRVRQDIVGDPSKFNMLYTDNTEPHIACPGGPAAGFPSGWAILCSASSPTITPTSIAQHTLFADDGHWASNGQRVLGSYYYCLVKLNWPSVIPPPTILPAPPRTPYPCTVFSEFATDPRLP